MGCALQAVTARLITLVIEVRVYVKSVDNNINQCHGFVTVDSETMRGKNIDLKHWIIWASLCTDRKQYSFVASGTKASQLDSYAYP